MALGRIFQLAFVINGSMSSSFTSSFSRSNQVMMRLRDTMGFIRNEQRRLNADFDAGRMSASQYASTMRNLQSEMSRTQSQQASLSAAMNARQQAGSRFATAISSAFSTVSTAAVVGAPLVGVIETAAKFEATMSKVRAITGATGEDFQKLTTKARELGEKTQFSATQSAEAMTYLGMAGWKTDQIMDGMPGLLNLAAAGGTNLARTADIISDDLTAFGLGADQAGRMADVFAKTITSTNTNIEMLGETMKYAAPVAHAFGATMEETSAMAGLMANSGIKASQAGTALRSGFLRLAGPPKMASKAMEKLGMSMKDITAEQKEAAMALESLGISMKNTDGPKKMSAILTELKNKTADLGKEEKLAMLKMIFGTEAATGWLAVLDAGPEKFDKMVYELENSQGAAENMAKIMQDNAVGAMTRLKSAAESVAISIGSTFLPSVTSVADKLAGWAGGLSRIATEYPNVVQGIVYAGSAMAGLMVYYKTTKMLSEGYAVIKSTLLLLYRREIILASTAQASTARLSVTTRIMAAAQWALNAAMTANPVGVVIAGIAALVAIGYVLYKNWDSVKVFFTTLWDSPAAKFAMFVTGPVGWVIAAVTGIIANWESVKTWFVTLWESPRVAMGQFAGMIKSQFAEVGAWLGGIWESVSAVTVKTWGSIAGSVTDAWQSFKAFCSNLPTMIAYGIGYAIGYLSTMPAKIGAFIETAKVWLSQLPEKCSEAGSAFVAAAEVWLVNAYSTSTTWLSAMVTDVGTWLYNLPQACSEAGSAFVAAAESWGSSAYNAISNWITQVPDMVRGQIGAAGTAISNWFDGLFSNAKSGFAAGAEANKIASNAHGGIYGRGAFLTTFAEESPEAAIPLNGSPRAISLWQQAGEMLGISPSGGSNSITATFSPQIHIAGNADPAVVQQIQQTLKESMEDFERRINALQSQKARVSYA